MRGGGLLRVPHLLLVRGGVEAHHLRAVALHGGVLPLLRDAHALHLLHCLGHGHALPLAAARPAILANHAVLRLAIRHAAALRVGHHRLLLLILLLHERLLLLQHGLLLLLLLLLHLVHLRVAR